MRPAWATACRPEGTSGETMYELRRLKNRREISAESAPRKVSRPVVPAEESAGVPNGRWNLYSRNIRSAEMSMKARAMVSGAPQNEKTKGSTISGTGVTLFANAMDAIRNTELARNITADAFAYILVQSQYLRSQSRQANRAVTNTTTPLPIAMMKVPWNAS